MAMDAVGQLYYDPKVVTDLSDDWDALLVVAKDAKDLPASLAFISSAIEDHIKVSLRSYIFSKVNAGNFGHTLNIFVLSQLLSMYPWESDLTVCWTVTAFLLSISQPPQLDAAAANDTTVVALNQPNVPAKRVVSAWINALNGEKMLLLFYDENHE